jgi:hypothetical protein
MSLSTSVKIAISVIVGAFGVGSIVLWGEPQVDPNCGKFELPLGYVEDCFYVVPTHIALLKLATILLLLLLVAAYVGAIASRKNVLMAGASSCASAMIGVIFAGVIVTHQLSSHFPIVGIAREALILGVVAALYGALVWKLIEKWRGKHAA